MTTVSGIRLNKFISDSGYCSRREADKLIEQNKVMVNGQPSVLGVKIMPGDTVKIGSTVINASAANKSDRVYLAYHKPRGITCTTEPTVRGNIIDAVRHPSRVFPIGRLDKDSEGLIFLTSDGDIVNKILRAGNEHDKEYIVTVNKPVTQEFVTKMAAGVPILDTVTKPCRVSIQSTYVFKIILTQGLNRQIRRMCEYMGYDVKRLKRTRIMSVKLSNLKLGEWRDLSESEMNEINQAVKNSKKTAEYTTPPKTTAPKSEVNSDSPWANAKPKKKPRSYDRERSTSSSSKPKKRTNRSDFNGIGTKNRPNKSRGFNG
ncbi:23S rRNA pseudouridine(2604) synthase RluF [Echinimonas agarilytica]|uniref:Pseudouridine synthase n=1 Tax=Echinimonas agarilytica TaxID=1215918 RepID=A0AA42B8X3_9GAMM|nr:23S rRNA pseudouridine(2604) synthase RluF [Echinimonas agarilytica]MCM2680651.1 23S rRNA pseudouridine(2604) synthase RluF [Echinimonas agarilytica]